jgi:hypothetical protein
MSGGDGGDDEEFNATTALKEAQQHLENATSYFPLNAAAWSMGANFGRMTHRLSLQQITAWYQQAATQAGQIRMDALALLEDKKVDDDVKDLIEMLLLTQVAGVDLDDPSDGSDDEDEEGDEGGIMSASTVESTSRFTAAMLLSTTGDHDRALEHLKEFPLTDRLHPKVWMGKATPIKSGTVATTDDGSAAPVSFQRPNGLLPSNLYEGLCKVFEPGAAYWKESDYDNNGYYSFCWRKSWWIISCRWPPNSWEKRRHPRFVVTNGGFTRAPSKLISVTTSISIPTKQSCHKKARSPTLSCHLYCT